MNSTSITMNSKEQLELIFYNFLKMLKRRKLIDNIEKNYSKYLDKVINEKIAKLDENSIYIIDSKISSIQNNSPLDEYLKSNINIKKFVLIKKPTKRTVKQLMNSKIYLNSEFFFMHEFLEDIPEKY